MSHDGAFFMPVRVLQDKFAAVGFENYFPMQKVTVSDSGGSQKKLQQD